MVKVAPVAPCTWTVCDEAVASLPKAAVLNQLLYDGSLAAPHATHDHHALVLGRSLPIQLL